MSANTNCRTDVMLTTITVLCSHNLNWELKELISHTRRADYPHFILYSWQRTSIRQLMDYQENTMAQPE